jgi:hypothetical protein
MRKMIFFLGILFLSPSITWAQEKVNAPVWNIGDKWVFTQGNIEVIGTDKKNYALNFSKDTCIVENRGFQTIIFEKPTLNRSYVLKEDKREKYTRGLRKILDFPLSIGKQWNDGYSGKAIVGRGVQEQHIFDCSEKFTVLGWEDVEVQAGKFKVFKLEYKATFSAPHAWAPKDEEVKHHYWYSPDTKYFVKCQYDKEWMKDKKEVFNWELTSFTLKK